MDGTKASTEFSLGSKILVGVVVAIVLAIICVIVCFVVASLYTLAVAPSMIADAALTQRAAATATNDRMQSRIGDVETNVAAQVRDAGLATNVQAPVFAQPMTMPCGHGLDGCMLVGNDVVTLGTSTPVTKPDPASGASQTIEVDYPATLTLSTSAAYKYKALSTKSVQLLVRTFAAPPYATVSVVTPASAVTQSTPATSQ